MAHYTIEATSGGGVVLMKTPLTAPEAYTKSVKLRHQGFTNITAVNMTSGRRIIDVQRLLGDVDA